MEIQRPSWSHGSNITISSLFLTNTFYFRNPATNQKRLCTQERSRGRQPAHFCEIPNSLETSQAVSKHLGHFRNVFFSSTPKPLGCSKNTPSNPELTRAFPRHLDYFRDILNDSETSRVFPLQSEYSLASVDI